MIVLISSIPKNYRVEGNMPSFENFTQSHTSTWEKINFQYFYSTKKKRTSERTNILKVHDKRIKRLYGIMVNVTSKVNSQLMLCDKTIVLSWNSRICQFQFSYLFSIYLTKYIWFLFTLQAFLNMTLVVELSIQILLIYSEQYNWLSKNSRLICSLLTFIVWPFIAAQFFYTIFFCQHDHF